jgi:2-C-methyl-D-erythritol 4-phosphate cytidylyltransferase
MTIAALVMAGGTGDRFAAQTHSAGPKQLTPLLGRAMVAWSVDAFAQSDRVAHVIIASAPDHESGVRDALSPVGRSKLRAFAPGGETRQESVFNALAVLPADVTHVLIHDAARPCVSASLVNRVLDALRERSAVVPTVAATDTLVREVDGRIDAVIDRVHVAGVQTPQAFRRELIERAHREARARGFQSSDDGSLVLALGEVVHAIAGERTNIKVTYREDTTVAEAVLSSRTNGART